MLRGKIPLGPVFAPPAPPPPPHRFPGVKFNWLATDHRALLSERLEQANSLELT